MLRDLLAIAHSDSFERKGRANIEEARWHGDDLELRFRLHPGRGSVQSWLVRASTVLEYSLRAAANCGFNHRTSDHPTIDQYTQPHEQLHFSDKPGNVPALVGDLWCAYHRVAGDWIEFDRYLNRSLPLPSLLASGSGLLFEGPGFLVEALAPVLLDAALQMNRLPSGEGTFVPSAEFLHFGESFVVARTFSAEQTAA